MMIKIQYRQSPPVARGDILVSKKTYLKSANNIIEKKIFFLTEQIKDEKISRFKDKKQI